MSKLKVLIAEDSKQIQLFYKRGLSENEFEIKMANDGMEAIAIYEEWKPDVILLDYMMPNLNGYQFLKDLRENKKDTWTTVIVVTGVTEKNDIVAFAKLGIQGYIVKPFLVEDLALTVKKHHKANSARIASAK
ncbi:MAG: response regulator [Proteobacteria bacterium]|nr:response regulator [Pseudomonadota bacterium]MBU1710302.1 response regulator [Pseudomonadota bacterium]